MFHVFSIKDGYHHVEMYKTFIGAANDIIHRSRRVYCWVIRDGQSGKRYSVAEAIEKIDNEKIETPPIL